MKPKPVTVLWSGSTDVLKVAYIRCLNGQVPEAFELWALVDDGVREFHPYARVLNEALNASVEFIYVFCITQHVGIRVDYTPNIFIHSWGVNATDMIPANVSTITRRAYDPIFLNHGFVLRSNHERLTLN